MRATVAGGSLRAIHTKEREEVSRVAISSGGDA